MHLLWTNSGQHTQLFRRSFKWQISDFRLNAKCYILTIPGHWFFGTGYPLSQCTSKLFPWSLPSLNYLKWKASVHISPIEELYCLFYNSPPTHTAAMLFTPCLTPPSRPHPSIGFMIFLSFQVGSHSSATQADFPSGSFLNLSAQTCIFSSLYATPLLLEFNFSVSVTVMRSKMNFHCFSLKGQA